MPTPADLTNALKRYQDARPVIRQAMHASALATALELADARDALIAKMEKRWRWCWDNTSHESFTDREDALIADIESYESHEDVLRLAIDVLFPEAA